MNERCRIGLHEYSDWEDRDDGSQTRSCEQCRKIDQRPWELCAPRASFDPYRDLAD